MALKKAHGPRGRKPIRSDRVTKQGGIPYTPVAQQNSRLQRNACRATQTPGQSTPPANSLVALLQLSLLALGAKLIELGFLKNWRTCPKCRKPLSSMQVLNSRLVYRCSKCRGNAGYISALRGSVLAKGLRLSLHQLCALLVCFSECVSATQATQLCGVSRCRVSEWYSTFRARVVKRMLQLQAGFGKQGGPGVVSEADEAAVASGPLRTPKNQVPRFSYTRIIALLVRGGRQLIIEKLPEVPQRYRLKGKQKTMSGGTVYFKKNRFQPPAPPPLSLPEGKTFLKKYFQGGVFSSDSAKTYDALVNVRKLFGKRSKNIRVVHGKEEWTKLYKTGLWGGTQYMDGWFGNYKQFAKGKHIRRSAVLDFVREYQYWFVTREKDRLVALGDACKPCAP